MNLPSPARVAWIYPENLGTGTVSQYCTSVLLEDLQSRLQIELFPICSAEDEPQIPAEQFDVFVLPDRGLPGR